MKRLLIIAAVMCGFSLAANAQTKAIGLRSGVDLISGEISNVFQISYEHWFNDPNFLEFELGVNNRCGENGFDLEGLYNWVVASPDWTDAGEWNFFVGAGAALGQFHWEKDVEGGLTEVRSTAYLGVCGQAGLEYTFWFPLQLSLDLRPMIKIGSTMLPELYPSISARYAF